MLKKPVLTLERERFAPYGAILDFSPGYTGFFEVLVSESGHPWRLAVYRDNRRASTFLENHPDSMETFEPVRGVALLLVAIPQRPEDFDVFLLDRPVCLHKGIWHDVGALSDDLLIRVTENLEVESVFHTFEAPYRPLLCQGEA